MSEQPPNRSLRLRHRVVGAAVLAALIAIFVPAVLDFNRPAETRITRTNIPERPADLRVEEIPLVVPDARPAVRDSGQAAEVREEPPGVASTQSSDEAESAAPDAAAAAAAPAAPSARAAWVVRLGSFSSKDNAVALRNRVRTAGFDAFVDEVKVDGTTMYRVHVGPEIDRARGDALRERLARELKLDGLVVGYE
jgi:DedD protein